MGPDPSDQQEQEKLRSYGFEAGEPVRMVTLAGFTLEQLKASLFDSTYDNPLVVPVKTGVVTLPVVVTRVDVRYAAHVDGSKNPVGCWRWPNWYIEGWLLKSGYDPYGEIVRVRMYVRGALDEHNPFAEEVFIQRIPANPDPDGTIIQIDDD